MSNATLIPDRRRKHFPVNGGPRPTEDETEAAHRGLDEARRALAEIDPHGPAPKRVIREMAYGDRAQARRGIARARRALGRRRASGRTDNRART